MDYDHRSDNEDGEMVVDTEVERLAIVEFVMQLVLGIRVRVAR